jgi:hypothetical protein
MKMRRSFCSVTFLIVSYLMADIVFAEDVKSQSKIFYRYKNERGVKVVAQTIPPKYVKAGYELVSVNGVVIKVVPPSPSDEDAERVANEKLKARELARSDLQLSRSYSKLSEIDAAKERNLFELRNNINILQGNLIGLRAQLKDQEGRAAAKERSGQKVSDDLVNNIAALRAEEKGVVVQIKQREIEYQASSDRFDRDKARFLEINKAKSPQ